MLYAAMARRDITPSLGTILFGYPNQRPAKAVNDCLTVDVLVVRDQTESAVIVSAAILLFDNERSQFLRQQISQVTGIPIGHIFLHAIHTHSAPQTGRIPGWSTINLPYCEDILEPAILEACCEAVQNLVPVELGIASGLSDVGVNRRQMLRDGSIVLGQNPWGTFDPTMTVLSFRSKGKIIANLIHYGCHCTAAGDNDEITRDWAGVMIDRLESISGGQTMFINGCEGDVGPRLSNGTTAYSTPYLFEAGERAAHDAVRIWKNIREYHDVALETAVGTQVLDYCPLPTRSDAEAAAEKIRKIAFPEALDILQLSHLDAILKELDSGKQLPAQRVTEQTILRIGSVAFVPFEYEMFCGVSLRLREQSHMPHVLCMSNTNGYLSYFPTKDQIPLGGYEIIDRAAAGAYILADNADDQIVEANLQIIEKMKQ